MTTIKWLENDAKVELLAKKILEERKNYKARNPQATYKQVEDHINRKFSKESDKLLLEQFTIIKGGL